MTQKGEQIALSTKHFFFLPEILAADSTFIHPSILRLLEILSTSVSLSPHNKETISFISSLPCSSVVHG